MRRSQEEDSPSPPPGHDQERGRPFFRGQPLLCKALRQAGRAGTPAHSQEAAWLKAEDGPERQEALGGGYGGATLGHPLRTARVPQTGVRGLGERIDHKPDAQTLGLQSKKRSMAAGERDEFLRAAWRMLVAGDIDARRLVFVDEMGTNVSLSPL